LLERLSAFDRKKCRGACGRARNPLLFFFGLEKRNREKSFVNALLNNQNVEITDEKEMLEVTHSYYSKLFSSEPIDENKTDHLYSLIKNKLTKEETDMTNSKITTLEIEAAINSLGNNKSPGSDGLTLEFLKPSGIN